MKARKVYVSLLFLLLGYMSNAQQEAMYSQYMFNMMTINPAYAGSRGVPNLSSTFRKQWVGIPGSPQTYLASFDMPLPDNRVALGLKMVNDQLGIEYTNSASLALAVRIPVSERAMLSSGIEFGFKSYRADLQQANTFIASDPSFSQNMNGVVPTLGIGVFYNTDKFYLGISSPNLMKSKLSVSQAVLLGGYSLSDLHIFIAGGYVFEMSEDVKIKPSFLLKQVSGAPTEIDLNTNLWLQDKIGIGVSYRTGDAIVGMFELQLNQQLRLGYAYDRSIQALGVYNQGTHEFMIRYEFGSSKDKIVSPRYF